jgi:ornithine cyclodeaminase
MLVLTHDEVERALPLPDCIEAIDAAMREFSRGNAVVPLRIGLPIPDASGRLVVMPGFLGAPRSFGLKIVAKYARPSGDLHGTHVGMVLLFDADTGLPLAMLEGGSLTEIRTAAATAVATRALAREDSSVLAVFGTGAQAARHALALCTVRPIRELRVWGRRLDRAEALLAALPLPRGVQARAVADVRAAMSGADVLCTTTAATEPFLRGEWLEPGQHVNLVGSAIPTTAEADAECVRRARYFVDSRTAAASEAGELRAAMAAGLVGPEHVLGEIGDVLDDRLAGRMGRHDVTLYKSLGFAAQDLAAAWVAHRNAAAHGLGRSIDLTPASPRLPQA